MQQSQSSTNPGPAEPAFVNHALALARRGWKVFPVSPGKVEPPLVKWGTAATCSEDIIRGWWSRWPDANVGVACGPSGLCVIDLDMKKGKDGRRELDRLEVFHGDLPDTLTAQTPSGGWHIYLKGETKTTVDLGGVHPGIDTRSGGGQGGYVLAPGSETNVGRYRWEGDPTTPVAELPAWLKELAGTRADRSHSDEAAVEPDQPHNVEWATLHLQKDAKLAVQGEGGNDATFRVACTLRDKGVSEGKCLALMLDHYNGRCHPPWDPEELGTVVANAYRYASVVPLGGDTAEADFADDEPPEVPKPKPLHPVLDKWVWVIGASLFVHRKGRLRWTAEQWKSGYASITEGNVLDKIWKDKLPLRKLTSLVYLPGRSEFPGDGSYNLWRPSGVKAAAGDYRWFDEHLAYMVPDPTEKGYVLDWLSLVARGQKVHFALLLASHAQGIGKGAVSAVMTRVLGEDNVSNPTNKEIAERFTAWTEGCQLAVVAELKADGRADTVNHLKPIISDPKLRIEVKNRTPYETPNHLNLLCSTNHLDALPIDAAERRWLVVASPASPRDTAYYDALFRLVESDEAVGAAKHWLLNRPVALDPKGRAPATAGKQEMGELAASEVETWLRTQLEARLHPFQHDLVRLEEVTAALDRRSKRPRHEVQKFLMGAGAVRHTPYKKDQRYPTAVLWSIRNHVYWRDQGAAGRAKAYDKMGSDDLAGVGSGLDGG